MRRLKMTGIAAAAVAALVAAGCSNGSDNGGNEAQNDDLDFALVAGTKGSPFYQAMRCGAESAAEELSINLTFAAPDQWGPADQLPILDSVAAQQPDALLVVPTDPDALTARITSIKEAGAPIVEVDQQLSDDSVSVSRIGTDEVEGGRTAADTLAELIGGSGKVMAISSPPGTDQQHLRIQGFEEKLAADYPEIEYLGVQHSLNDVSKSAGYVTSTIASHPDLAGIFVSNDVNAMGVIAGLKEANAVGEVMVVAYDAANTEIEALQNGEIQALIAQDPFGQGYEGVKAGYAAVNDEEVEREIALPLTVLSLDDEAVLEEYIDRNSGAESC